MSKPSVSQFFKDTRMVLAKHSPEILTGIGIAGMVTTTVLAVKATPKALKLIETRKQEEEVEKLAPVEVIKTTWKCYIPAAVTGVTSIACLVGASSVNLRRNAALATAYKLSETALTEYREKVVETIGEKKEKDVRSKINKDRVENNPVSENKIIVTQTGTTKCLDVISGRYFYSDYEKIRRAENKLNKQILSDICGFVSLNQFYDELGLPHIKIGDDLGWNLDNTLELDLDAQLDESGIPCVVLDYGVGPQYNYTRPY